MLLDGLELSKYGRHCYVYSYKILARDVRSGDMPADMRLNGISALNTPVIHSSNGGRRY